MTTVDPQCFHCKHFKEEPNEYGLYGCDAFPDGIPLAIWMNYVIHNKSFSDHGTLFEQKEE
jgi:hypothetical protein